MSASLRALMMLGGFLLLALPGTAQRRETDVERDLRMFYEGTGQRTVWIDERGRPTLEAQRVLARLRDVAEDGVEPGEYRVEGFARLQAQSDGGDR